MKGITMTSKNSTAKATETVEGAEAEASVPQQNTGEKITVLKQSDGKDAIFISPEDEVDNTLKGKFNRLIRNKKVLAGLGAVATLALVAIIKSATGTTTEFEYTHEDVVEPELEGDDTDTDTTD